jgi:excisionase family DNA binding protein
VHTGMPAEHRPAERSGRGSRGPDEAETTYATGEAARVLGVSGKRVRRMIASGELASSRDEAGRHRIPRAAVHAKLEERGPTWRTGDASLDRVARGEPAPLHDARGERPREELEDVRRGLRGLAEEVRALRRELAPLARLARSAAEEKERALRENAALREERVRLTASLEEERGRADGLAREYESFRLRWWGREVGPKEEAHGAQRHR